MSRGQTTDHVAQILDSLNIKVVKVPANMTQFSQPLDLTVNGSTKNFMRKRFVTWYAEEIKQKALHANWSSSLHANWLSCTMFLQLLMEERRS